MQVKESKTNSHFVLSVFKSIIRLVACYALYTGEIKVGALLFASAELVGILEEF